MMDDVLDWLGLVLWVVAGVWLIVVAMLIHQVHLREYGVKPKRPRKRLL